MDITHLAGMANQIGDYFAAYPDRNEAIKAIAQHIKNYWEPRMRREIIAYVTETGGSTLKGAVRQAVLMLESEAKGQSFG